jgi:hypothetical protein
MKSSIPQKSTLFSLALNILLMIFVDPFIIPAISCLQMVLRMLKMPLDCDKNSVEELC